MSQVQGQGATRGQGQGKEGKKKVKKKKCFLTHSSLFSTVPIPEINLLTVWNKPFGVLQSCMSWMEEPGRTMGTDGQSAALLCHRLEQPDWIQRACDLVLRSNDISYSAQNSFPLDYKMDCICRFLSLYWVSPICLLKAISRRKKKKKTGVDVWLGGKKRRGIKKKKPVISTFPPPPSSTSVAQSEPQQSFSRKAPPLP